jgi:hypothetical protein
VEQRQDEHLLHVSVSNQSLSQPVADLAIGLDEEQLFRREMETGTQHTWEETTTSVVGGHHTLVITEARTRTREVREVNVDRELWIVVTFHSPPERIRVDISDRSVGLM